MLWAEVMYYEVADKVRTFMYIFRGHWTYVWQK